MKFYQGQIFSLQFTITIFHIFNDQIGRSLITRKIVANSPITICCVQYLTLVH